MGNRRIRNVASPSLSTDVANKAYVDSNAGGNPSGLYSGST